VSNDKRPNMKLPATFPRQSSRHKKRESSAKSEDTVTIGTVGNPEADLTVTPLYHVSVELNTRSEYNFLQQRRGVLRHELVILANHWRFSRRWGFKSRSSGLWSRIVLWQEING